MIAGRMSVDPNPYAPPDSKSRAAQSLRAHCPHCQVPITRLELLTVDYDESASCRHCGAQIRHSTRQSWMLTIGFLVGLPGSFIIKPWLPLLWVGFCFLALPWCDKMEVIEPPAVDQETSGQ